MVRAARREGARRAVHERSRSTIEGSLDADFNRTFNACENISVHAYEHGFDVNEDTDAEAQDADYEALRDAWSHEVLSRRVAAHS